MPLLSKISELYQENKIMKIIFVIHQFYPNHCSGTERVIFTTIKYLQKLKISCLVVSYSLETLQYPSYCQNASWQRTSYEGVDIINFVQHDKSPDFNQILFHEEQLPFFDELFQREKPDIVHVAHTMRVGAACFSAIKNNIPYVLNLTDFYLLCHFGSMRFSFTKMCSGGDNGRRCQNYCFGLPPDYYRKRFDDARLILKKSSANFIGSEWLNTIFMNNFQMDINPVYIPYGLDRSYLGLNLKTYSTTADSPLKFVFIGHLTARKGVHVLIKAIKLCTLENVKFIIYGDGPMRAKVEALSNKDSRVCYMETYKKEQTAEILEDADVGVVPSVWYENNPIILQEMLAMNLPVIATNIGSIPELIIHNVNGFLFELGNAEQLSKIFERLIADQSILNALKINFLHNQIYTIEQSVCMLLKKYNEILNSK